MKGVRGARKRGVERFWALYCPEALGIGSSVALEDKEANALRNLARLTSLVISHPPSGPSLPQPPPSPWISHIRLIRAHEP